MRKTILVIENDEIVRENLQFVLEMKGYDVVTAKDSRAGFTKAVHLRPDLVMNASSVSDKDELNVFKRIRANPRTAGVRFMWIGDPMAPALHEEYNQLGGCAFLNKPFAIQDLIDLVQYLTNADKKGNRA